jgi:hypothetical protein
VRLAVRPVPQVRPVRLMPALGPRRRVAGQVVLVMHLIAFRRLAAGR